MKRSRLSRGAWIRRRVSVRRSARRRGGITPAQRQELDDLAKTFVMVRAGAAHYLRDGHGAWWGTCQKCGREGGLSWCHVHTRAAWAVRWSPDNAFAWCAGCHRYLDQHFDVKERWCRRAQGDATYERVLLTKASGVRAEYAGVRFGLVLDLQMLYGVRWDWAAFYPKHAAAAGVVMEGGRAT